MNPLPIDGCTRRMGAPDSWDHAGQGICHTLEIVDHDGWMVSVWQPSPAELKLLNDGKPVRLFIQGSAHPVVSLDVLP